MDFDNIVHRGLKRLLDQGDRRGLPPAVIEKIRNILFLLDEVETIAELEALKLWKIHRLTGNRKGTYSLTVTPNWRITFKVDESRKTIIDLDFEDYH